MTTKAILTISMALFTTAGMAQSTEPVAPAAPAAVEAPMAPQAPMTAMHHDDGMTLENGKWMKDGRKASKAEIDEHAKMMQMPK